MKFSLQKLTSVSFFRSDVPPMLLGICARWWWRGPPLPPWLVCLHFLVDDVVPYQWQTVPPPVSVEAWVQGSDVYGLLHFSFKPSVVGIAMLSNSTECWGWSIWMCFATSEVVALGHWRSLSLAFIDLSVSHSHTASHSKCKIWSNTEVLPHSRYSLGPSVSRSNNGLSVFVGLKYIGIPYLPPTRLSWFENPFCVWDHDRNFFYLSFSDVSIASSDVSISSSDLLCCPHSNPLKSILGKHSILVFLLEVSVHSLSILTFTHYRHAENPSMRNTGRKKNEGKAYHEIQDTKWIGLHPSRSANSKYCCNQDLVKKHIQFHMRRNWYKGTFFLDILYCPMGSATWNGHLWNKIRGLHKANELTFASKHYSNLSPALFYLCFYLCYTIYLLPVSYLYFSTTNRPWVSNDGQSWPMLYINEIVYVLWLLTSALMHIDDTEINNVSCIYTEHIKKNMNSVWYYISSICNIHSPVVV